MSDAEKGGFISKVIGPKRRWREYRARVKQLPENYRTAVEAIQRYLMSFGPMDGDNAASLLEDVADLFERAAADGTPIREIVGDDPVEFVEALIRNYEKGGYVTREQDRLSRAIERAARRGHRKQGGIPMTTRQAQAIRVQGLDKSHKQLHVCSARTGRAKPRS